MSILLNLDALNAKEEINDDLETFEMILKKCHSIIQQFSSENYKECIINPERKLYGRPLYEYDNCIKYLINALSNNGLYVKYKKNEGIYVSWKKEDIDLEKYYNKILPKVDENINVYNKVSKISKKGKEEIINMPVTKLHHSNSKINDFIPINLNLNS